MRVNVEALKDGDFDYVLSPCGSCTSTLKELWPRYAHRLGSVEKRKVEELAAKAMGCESCANVCAGGIDLPRLIREVRSRLNAEQGAPVEANLLSAVMKNRKLFHRLLKFASFAQKPFTRGAQFQRHLPAVFLGKHNFKALPAIANKSFRDRWPDLAPRVQNPKLRVAIFSGCAQDFIYPEELEACVKILAAKNVAVDFPMVSSCGFHSPQVSK